MKSLLATVLAATCFILPAAAHAGDVDDTVLLTNGGRVRGSVMEEDPKTGVTIKLLDGTVRKLKPAEVKSVEYGKAPAAAPPAAAPVPPPPGGGTTTGAVPAAPPPPAPAAGTPLYNFQGGAPYPGGAPRKHSHRRSTGLFVTGLILMPLGAIAVGAGGVFTAATKGLKHDEDVPPAVALFAGGGTFLITGMIFTIVGGGHTGGGDDDAKLTAPRVSPYVGPRSFGFTGTF